MKFTHQYFPDHIKTWEKFLSDYKGKKNLKYLEIGVFEGQSAFWMKENILTHPSAEMVLIDYFHPLYEEIFLENLNEVDHTNIKILKGNSSEVLKGLKNSSFDIIYIDGGHIAKDIFLDLALSWKLLKDDGVMIIDDYPLLKNKAPIHMRPEMVIDCFLTSFSEELSLLHKEWQIILKKKKNDLKEKDPYSWNKYQKIGDYFFNWHTFKLINNDGEEATVKLTSKEKILLEHLLQSLKLGETKLELSQELREKESIKSLFKKLNYKD